MNGSFFRLLLPLIALLLAFGAAAMLTAQEAELRISESSTAKEPEGRLLLAAPLSEEENPQNLTTEVFIEFDPSTDSNARNLISVARATKPAISPKDAMRPKRIRVDVPFTRPAEGSQALIISKITLTATGEGWTKTYSKQNYSIAVYEPFAIAPLPREDTLAVKLLSKSHWTGMCQFEVSTSLPQLRQAELDSSVIYVFDKDGFSDKVYSPLEPVIDSSGRFTFSNLPYKADLFKSKTLRFTLEVKPKGKASIMRSTIRPVPIPPVIPWFLILSIIITTVAAVYAAVRLKPAYSKWKGGRASRHLKDPGDPSDLDKTITYDALISIEPKDTLQLKEGEKNVLLLRVRRGEELSARVLTDYAKADVIYRPQAFLEYGTERIFLGQNYTNEILLKGGITAGYVIKVDMPRSIPQKPVEMKLIFRIQRLGPVEPTVGKYRKPEIKTLTLSRWLHFPATTVAGKPTIIVESERPPSPVISPPAQTSTPAAASFGDATLGDLPLQLPLAGEALDNNINMELNSTTKEVSDFQTQLQTLQNSVTAQTGDIERLMQLINQMKYQIYDFENLSQGSKLSVRMEAIENSNNEVISAINDLREKEWVLGTNGDSVYQEHGRKGSGTTVKQQQKVITAIQSRLDKIEKSLDSEPQLNAVSKISLRLEELHSRLDQFSSDIKRLTNVVTELCSDNDLKLNQLKSVGDPKWWRECVAENCQFTSNELAYVAVLLDLQTRLSKIKGNADRVGVKQLSVKGKDLLKLEDQAYNPGPDTEAKHFVVMMRDGEHGESEALVFLPPHRIGTVSNPIGFKALIEPHPADSTAISRPARLIHRQTDDVWEIVEKMQLSRQ